MDPTKYRQSYPIPVWNGILDHKARIGNAIWVFLWCIDRITREENSIGLVFGGTAVTTGRISRELGYCEKHVRRHLRQLSDGGYLLLRRVACGFVISVTKSKKFKWQKRAEQSGQKCPIAPSDKTKMSDQTGQERPVRSDKDVRSNMDAALAESKEPS